MPSVIEELTQKQNLKVRVRPENDRAHALTP